MDVKNVLYLSYDGMTDPLGQSQVLPYLKGLSEKGYRFHLISFEKPEKFAQHEAHIRTICASSGIAWHPLTYTKNPPLLSTMWDLYKMNKRAFSLHKQHRFSIVHCRSYISAMVGMAMKRRTGTRFLFDMRGFWADERVDGGIWSLSNPVLKTVYRFFKRKETEFFREADHIVSLTSNGKEEIMSWESLKDRELKITVIPCCVDLDLFDPGKIRMQDKEQLKARLGITGEDFILGYVGSIGTWYMLPEMLDYFKALKAKRSNARFLFVSGENPDSILQKAREKGIDTASITIVSCLHRDVPLHLSLFDLSIFFIRPTFSKKASSPTKQGEIMAMGIPLVCNQGVGDTDLVVQKYRSGEVIGTLEESAYQRSAASLPVCDPEEIKAGAADFFSLEKGTASYLEIYKRLS